MYVSIFLVVLASFANIPFTTNPTDTHKTHTFWLGQILSIVSLVTLIFNTIFPFIKILFEKCKSKKNESQPLLIRYSDKSEMMGIENYEYFNKYIIIIHTLCLLFCEFFLAISMGTSITNTNSVCCGAWILITGFIMTLLNWLQYICSRNINHPCNHINAAHVTLV
jgi:hypothetical protein